MAPDVATAGQLHERVEDLLLGQEHLPRQLGRGRARARLAQQAQNLLLLAVLATACGDDEESASAPTATATPSATATPEPATKPTVRVPSGKPPRRLAVRDLRTGTGPVATAGSTVTVHYVGVHFKGGKQFDASWDGGEPFSFALGGGQVIAGWDKGVVGMRVGGRRELIIPPSLGYGSQGYPPDIKPNETLVFVVDLLGVE